MAQGLLRRIHYLGEELPDLVVDNGMKIRSKLFGLGGCGCNSANRLKDMDVDNVEIIAMNTDVQKLYMISADRKLLLGQNMLHGMSTAGSPYLGRKAARAARKDIDAMIRGSDIVYIVAGLGGGTGSGAAPEVASRARHLGAVTIGLVAIPFSVSGRLHRRRAERALRQLRRDLDAMIIVPNDHLLEVHPSIPVDRAFGMVDEALRSIMVGISRGMTRASLHDLRKTLGHCEVVLGLGCSKDIVEAVDQAVEWPLSEYKLAGKDPVLAFLQGGIEMDRAAAESAMERLMDQLGNERHYYWAADQGTRSGRSSVTLVIPAGHIRKEEPAALDDWIPAVDGASLLHPTRV